MSSIDELLHIMAALRDPRGGCPWDLEQTFATIAPYTIEEAYEVADAIEHGDMDGLRGELGDLLFQVVFHARMAEEQGRFGFDDVVAGICDKMRRRHPHVFGDDEIESAEEQTRAWEAHKARERGERGSVLDGVTRALPALVRSGKLQRRAARVGFDWPDISGPMEKCREELDELALAITDGTDADREHELGDLLFSCVNLARHMGVDAEQALRAANERFEGRFSRVESRLRERGIEPGREVRDEMERLWSSVKAEEGGCAR